MVREMKCNYKKRYRDRVVGGTMDEGCNFGILAVTVKAHELYGIGTGRIRKLEDSIRREITKVKGGYTECSAEMSFAVESWIMKTDRDYQNIYKDHNYRYRNYPDKQVTYLFADDYQNQLANVGTADKYSDSVFDCGVWIGIKTTLKHLNYSLQIGAPRLSKLEVEVMEYVKTLRKYNLNVACKELWNEYLKIDQKALKRTAKAMGADNALAALQSL